MRLSRAGAKANAIQGFLNFKIMKCIIEGCERTSKTRGLCKTCYTSASNAVKRGKVTSWEFLEENGLALPAAGQQQSTFSTALTKKLNDLNRQPASAIVPKHGGGN